MSEKVFGKIFPSHISKKEATDTGMAMVLLALLGGWFTKNNTFYYAAIPLLVINMTFPKAYYAVAVLWLGLTNLLGSIISRILLSVVYLVILLPMGIIRQLMGKDSLYLKAFKKDSGSVMLNREHQFTADDIKNPF